MKKCKNNNMRGRQGYHDCNSKGIKLCQLKSASKPKNVYEGEKVLICANCRRGIENGGFKIVKEK